MRRQQAEYLRRRIFCRVTKDQRLDFVGGGVRHPPKRKKRTGRAGAGNAPAPNDTERKKMTEIYQGAARDERT
jgi:hypothetical protein